jgi:hypothetical protein
MPRFGWVFRRNPVEGCRFRQIRRPAHGTLYLQKIISLVSKSLDWVVNISSLIAAQVRPVFDLGKDAAFPSGGSIMTTHPSNHAGTSSSVSTNTAPPETRRQQSLWSGIGASRLREALAEMVKATKPSAPAIDFGQYVRQELDRSPDRVEGMFAMARLLGCDPIGREVESLKRDVADLKTQPPGQASAHPSARQDLEERRRMKAAGGNKTRTTRKSEKRATKKLASKLLRQLQKQVLQEVRDELGEPGESIITREMADRVFSKSDSDLTAILHERFDFPLAGRKTLSRTNEYKSWASHRGRGNSRRLDPESPAVDANAAGGESSKSGATRNAGYLAENGLHEGRFSSLRPLDAEGRQKVNNDPDSRDFALNHRELFNEDVD